MVVLFFPPQNSNPNSPEPVDVEWLPFTLPNEDYLHLEAAKTAARRHCRARRTAFWLDYIPELKAAVQERRDKCEGDEGTNDSAGMFYSLNVCLSVSAGYFVLNYSTFL